MQQERNEANRPTASPPHTDVEPTLLQTIPLTDIDTEDTTFQFRFRSSSRLLVESLAAQGQLDPIKVIGSRGGFRILDGFCRTRSALHLGWPTIRAMIYPAMTHEQSKRVAFVSNVVRKNLSARETANAIHIAEREGYPRPEVARMFGLSTRQVNRYRRIPDTLVDRIDGRVVTMAHAEHLQRILDQVSENELDDILDLVRVRKMSSTALRSWLRSAGILPGRSRRASGSFGTCTRDRIRIRSLDLRRSASEEQCRELIRFLTGVCHRLEGFCRESRDRISAEVTKDAGPAAS